MRFVIPEMKMGERYSYNMGNCNCTRMSENQCGIQYRVGSL